MKGEKYENVLYIAYLVCFALWMPWGWQPDNEPDYNHNPCNPGCHNRPSGE